MTCPNCTANLSGKALAAQFTPDRLRPHDGGDVTFECPVCQATLAVHVAVLSVRERRAE